MSMPIWTQWRLALMCMVLGCGGARPSPLHALPLPTTSSALGPGDVLLVDVVGEKDLPHEFQVRSDGMLEFPYIKPFVVTGLEPQQLATQIKEALTEQKILRSPQVSLTVKAYAAKKVYIVGSVVRPGPLFWTQGLQLVDAIAQAGWFTALGDSSHVRLTRLLSTGKRITVLVSVDSITDGPDANVPLQAGDIIKVEQRVF